MNSLEILVIMVVHNTSYKQLPIESSKELWQRTSYNGKWYEPFGHNCQHNAIDANTKDYVDTDEKLRENCVTNSVKNWLDDFW